MNKIFKVGGAVRDSFLGRISKDIDFAVETDSFDSMRQIILGKGGKIFVETPKFGTIRANVPGLGSADYVICRKDGVYSDGRHPDSVTVGTLLDDLARRDFTMNSIAEDVETHEIFDPFCGIADISRMIIRSVGSARARFDEDKLRMFRALRFTVVLNFRMESDIVNAIGAFTPAQFDAVSTERVREELLKMFEVDTARSFKLLQDFPNLWEVVTQRGIWFKPTICKK